MPKQRPEDRKVQLATIVVSDFSEGEYLDGDSYFNPPRWRKLENLYIDNGGFAHGRPHCIEHADFANNLAGLAIANDRDLLIAANDTLYKDISAINALPGTGPVKYDTTRDRTVITAGGKPLIVQGDTASILNQDNVYALATFQGNKFRLGIVQSTNKRAFKVSTIGNVNDFGTLIIGSAFNDEYTEGITLYNLPYDIVDLVEYQGDFIFLTEGGLVKFRPGQGDTGFDMQGDMIRQIEVWDSRVLRYNNALYFSNSDGIWQYSASPQGDAVQKLPMKGMERTILGQMRNGEVRINVDMARGLLLVTPNMTDSITYVFHPEGGFWTHWDIPINDTVEIDGVTYVTLNNDTKVYTFTEDATVAEGYVLSFRGGLADFGQGRTRKRFMVLGAELQTATLSDYLMEIFVDNYPEITPPLIEVVSEIENPLEVLLGDQGLRGSVTMLFKNRGKFVLNNAYVHMKLKPERLGFS